MHEVLTKLWASKGTISILLWVAVFAWLYNLDWAKKPTIKQETHYKTIEEIIATPVDKISTPTWDTEFRSSVEAVK